MNYGSTFDYRKSSRGRGTVSTSRNSGCMTSNHKNQALSSNKKLIDPLKTFTNPNRSFQEQFAQFCVDSKKQTME